jgi:branched-chain amino acid transport system substrate-binding protein
MKFFPWTVSWFQPTERRIGGIAAAWGKQYPAMKKVVQFLEDYGPFPGMAAAHSKGLSGLGITMLPNVEVPADAVTFGPLVVKALAEKPDGIVLVVHGDKAAKIIQELKNRGWTKISQILVFSSADVPELYTTVGNEINGVTIYNYINPNTDNPRWNSVKEAYLKSHNGSSPPSLLPNYYDAVYMIKEAIENTAITGDPKKLQAERKMIADYIANVKGFKGLMYDWDMSDGIPTNKPNYLCTIQDGKKINVREVH